MISRISLMCLSILLVFLAMVSGACSQTTVSQDESRNIAEAFVKADATYIFDGMPETLELTGTTQTDNGWQFTYEFDSRHAGYGDRTGQILAQVITHHVAVVAVESGKVTSAIMGGVWDMKNNEMLEDFEISLAPIHEVTVSFMESYPVQVGVYIQGGLRDGCTEFHDIEIAREGDVVNITVTVQHPKDTFCPAIYTYFEKYINLGSDFTTGTTYTLNVNDFTTTFIY
ncbi:MAG: hypothetical protein JXA17_01400 [Dehalococcoidales bacterium]|nr:hypothetical protein [Dehalococcoidales bacterium]